MSKSRKHVKNNALNSFPVPEGNQIITKVAELRGGNLCEVLTPAGGKLVVRVPSKFNKVIWIGRGDYLIVEPSNESVKMQSGEIKGHILHVLYKDQIHHLKSLKLWPEQFSFADSDKPPTAKSSFDLSPDSDESSEELGKVVNPNHVGIESEGEDEDEYSF